MLAPWKKSYDQPAAAAKSLQSCSTLCDPIDGSPPGSPLPGILQARILEWVAIFFSLTNLDSILKSRDITLSTNVHLVKAMVFPVVMYGCESWTIKKAERQRIDAFELWCWEDSSESLDCKEIQPVWMFIGRTDAEAETPILWPPDAKSWLIWKWCWERLKAGGEGDSRGWDGWMASLTQWTWVWVNSMSWWWTGMPGVLQSMGSQRVRHDWTELNWYSKVAKRVD